MKTRGIVRWSATVKPDTKYEPHKWYVDLAVDKEEAKRLKDVGLKVKTIINEETEEITYSFRASRNVYKRSGKQVVGNNPKPIVVDSALNTFDGIIGNGSEVIVVHRPWQWKNKKGFSSDLKKIQILTLVPYASAADEPEEDKLEVIGDGIDKTTIMTKERAKENQSKDKEDSKEDWGDDLDF